ncbi:Uncharacterized protein QTN25_010507 [Entamoeba marina]
MHESQVFIHDNISLMEEDNEDIDIKNKPPLSGEIDDLSSRPTGIICIEYLMEDPIIPLFTYCTKTETDLMGTILQTSKSETPIEQQQTKTTDFLLVFEEENWTVQEIHKAYSATQIFLKNTTIPPPNSIHSEVVCSNEINTIEKNVLRNYNTTISRPLLELDSEELFYKIKRTETKNRAQSIELLNENQNMPWNCCKITDGLSKNVINPKVVLKEAPFGRIEFGIRYDMEKKTPIHRIPIKEVREEMKEFNAESWMFTLKKEPALKALHSLKKRKKWEDESRQLYDYEQRLIKKMITSQRQMMVGKRSDLIQHLTLQKHMQIQIHPKTATSKKQIKLSKRKCVKHCVDNLIKKLKLLCRQDELKEIKLFLRRLNRNNLISFQKDVTNNVDSYCISNLSNGSCNLIPYLDYTNEYVISYATT